MNIIKAQYIDGKEFLKSYQPDFSHGGLFIPTRARYEVGSQVIIDVRFNELRSTILVRGLIAWRRAGKHRTKLRAGVGVEFLSSEQKKCEFLLGVAEGKILDLMQRRRRRLPIVLDIGWRSKAEREWHTSYLEDIGEGGAFIRSTELLSEGSPVILEVTAPGGQRAIALEGRVAWIQKQPEADQGMGVEFRRRDAGGVRLVRELLRRLENTSIEVDDYSLAIS